MSMQLETDAKAKKPKTQGWIWIAAVLVALVLMTVLALFVSFNLRTYEVSGTSMRPTLTEGDRVRFDSSLKPGYGDLVVFYSSYELLVKRVIGLPGDRISVSADGQVTRNGEAVDEPYITKDALGNSRSDEMTVDEGCLFVMGDNRGASVDSRDIRIGQIKDSMVCGCVTQIERENETGMEDRH